MTAACSSLVAKCWTTEGSTHALLVLLLGHMLRKPIMKQELSESCCSRYTKCIQEGHSTDEDPNHTRYPSGEEPWCFFKRAEAREDEPPSRAKHVKHPQDVDVAATMVPIYERMSDPNLLKRMLKGKTQNSNECLHSFIWSRCTKTVCWSPETQVCSSSCCWVVQRWCVSPYRSACH